MHNRATVWVPRNLTYGTVLYTRAHVNRGRRVLKPLPARKSIVKNKADLNTDRRTRRLAESSTNETGTTSVAGGNETTTGKLTLFSVGNRILRVSRRGTPYCLWGGGETRESDKLIIILIISRKEKRP